MAKPTLHREIPALAKNYDIVVIDGAPRVNELGRAAIMASDLALIPVQPSPYDVWAAAETVQLIREAQQFKERLRSAFLINRKISNTAIGRDFHAALEQFPETPVLDVAPGPARACMPKAPRAACRCPRPRHAARRRASCKASPN